LNIDLEQGADGVKTVSNILLTVLN